VINEIGSKKYQANKLDNNFGTERVHTCLCKLLHTINTESLCGWCFNCSEERAERLALLRNHVGSKSPEMSRVRAPRKGGKRHHNVANGNGSLWISAQEDGDSENGNADGMKRLRPKVTF
jgi:hypothetical protein